MLITKKRLLPLFIIGTAIVLFYLLVLTAPQQPPVAPVERSWLVDTVTAQPETLSPSLILYGVVETPDLLSNAAPAQGYVLEILVREGHAIHRGQKLLTLDPRDFEPRVRQAEADVAELEAQIVSEKLRYASDRETYAYLQDQIRLGQAAVERAERLKKQNMGSTAALDESREDLNQRSIELSTKKLEIDDHKARLDLQYAKLNRAKAELELARLDLERSVITAPFDGYVAEIDVSTGDAVSANQFLLSIYPSNTLEIRAKIPAQYQLEIQNALISDGELRGNARLGQLSLPLRLARLAGSADTRGIDGLFQVVNGFRQLRIGTSLPLALLRPAYPQAIALPYSALYGSDLVYKLEDERFRSVKVRKLGEYIAEDGSSKLLITSVGLTKGDAIVTTHLPNAISGLKAEPRNRVAEQQP